MTHMAVDHYYDFRSEIETYEKFSCYLFFSNNQAKRSKRYRKTVS